MFTYTQQKKKEQHEKNTHTSKITTCTYFARAKTLKKKNRHAYFVHTTEKKKERNKMFAFTQQKNLILYAHNRKK